MKRSREQARLESLFTWIAAITLLLIIFCGIVIPATIAAAPDAILGSRQTEIPESAGIVFETMRYARQQWVSPITLGVLTLILVLAVTGSILARKPFRAT
jgi:hypothetical protein